MEDYPSSTSKSDILAGQYYEEEANKLSHEQQLEVDMTLAKREADFNLSETAQDFNDSQENGCPRCGSYEGDWNECPECGHGQ